MKQRYVMACTQDAALWHNVMGVSLRYLQGTLSYVRGMMQDEVNNVWVLPTRGICCTHEFQLYHNLHGRWATFFFFS